MDFRRTDRRALPAAIALSCVLSLCAGLTCVLRKPGGPAPPIKVGVLHSLTGPVAISERDINDATLMAIEEINRSGGLLGRTVEPVVVDGRSDWPTFARQTGRLLTRDRVSAIFGCYTSASRKTVLPIVEGRRGVLFYPTLYEGMESSPNIVYTGPAPNQFITPAVKWFLDNRGRKMFLVGSDYVFPRASNAIIKDQLARLGGAVVGEAYMPLGEKDVRAVVDRIIKARPEVILSSVVGDTNVPFFRALRAAGVNPRTTPVLSIVVSESEMKLMESRDMVQNYIATGYFQSIASAENHAFVARFKRRFGPDSVISDTVEAGYTSVHLWARAVRKAGNVSPAAVLRAIRGLSYAAPEGRVYVDEENLHTWKSARIGQIRRDGQVDIVWQSESVLHPVPYPPYRTRRAWHEMLGALYTGWGGSWARPTPP